MKKRIISLFLVLILIFSVNVNGAIYEEKNEKILSRGVTLTSLKRFTVNGWQNINIVTADLSEKYITADIITPSGGMDSLENVKTMAEKNNSVVAINADFFSWSGNTGTKGSAIGTVIKDNTLLSSSYEVDDTCATLLITDNDRVLLDYVNTDITITAPNGNTAAVKHLNKYDSLSEICIYTSDFKKVTDGSYNNILEMVVVNGTVTEMRREMDGITVPENGYVIRHLPEYDPFLTDNFNVGDEIEIDIQTSIDLEKIKSAVGAGTKLVENGKPAKITHNISGTQPRTLAAVDKTGRTLYLITVDGRQTNAVGMTLDEATEFLLELGVYNAVNLDGGGSTTLVTKDNGVHRVINSPSQSSLRPVANGLGIFSNAPRGSFTTFDIICNEKTMLSNTTKTFTVGTCYDEFHNPLNMNTRSVTWSADERYGFFKENIFHATNPGENVEITATIGNISTKTYITVYNAPQRLSVSPSHFNKENITVNDFNATGYDKNGNSAEIEARDITLTHNTSGEIGSKKVTVAQASSFISYSLNETDNFETVGFTHTTYPKEFVSGNVTLTDYLSKSGKTSAKLSYDFTNGEAVTKASYLVFNSPKNVGDSSKIGVWVYSPGPSRHTIKAELKTSQNELCTATLCEKVDFNGWKYLTGDIPENAAVLTKLYIVQNNTGERTKGFILFDDLTLFNSGTIDFSETKDAYTVSQNNETASLSFLVTGKLAPSNTLLAKVLKANVKTRLQSFNADYCWSLENVTYDDFPVIIIDGYKSFIRDNNLFINLNNSDAYISKPQFEKLSKDLKAKSYSNIFVFMNEDFSLMADKSELKVLKALLSDAAKTQNVYAFYNADGDNMYKEGNVNYIAVKGINNASALAVSQNIDTLTCVKVDVEQDSVKVNFENFLK